MSIELLCGDCREVLPSLTTPFDCVVTDPPYELGFMGKDWDRTGVAFDPATWATVLNAVKPGGYLLAFAGARTQHRIACAIEDGGWQIRDTLLWLYGTGFPKGKGCLKPAYEPIVLARRPGPKVLPLGVEECRVPAEERPNVVGKPKNGAFSGVFREGSRSEGTTVMGRYPANVLHDGSDEVLEAFAAFGEKGGGFGVRGGRESTEGYRMHHETGQTVGHGDTGTAARFFYCAKASKSDRGEGNTHPTVKPTELMRWLVRLVCPKGGSVLDPFAGSGSTGKAALLEKVSATLIEQTPEYCEIVRKRLAADYIETVADSQIESH